MEVTIVKLSEEIVEIQFNRDGVVSPVYQMKPGDKLDLGSKDWPEVVDETESS